MAIGSTQDEYNKFFRNSLIMLQIELHEIHHKVDIMFNSLLNHHPGKEEVINAIADAKKHRYESILADLWGDHYSDIPDEIKEVLNQNK